MIRTAVNHCIWGATTGGDIGKLFILALGGSPVHVGLLATLSQAAPIGQVLGLRVLPRIGKARMVMWGDLASMVPMAMLLLLAAFGWPSQEMVILAIGGYACATMLRSTGQTGWWPLLQDVTAGETMGAFFARLRTYLRFVEILLPMAVGAYLGARPSVSRFLLPMVVGTCALVAGAACVRRTPERHIAVPRIGLFLRLRLAFKSRNVRNYVAFVCQYSFLGGLVTPFWVVMLNKYRGLPNNYTVWLTTAAAIGHMTSLKFWGRLVDDHGGRPALSISLLGMSLMGVAWLALPAGGVELILWAMPFYVLWGFFQGGLMMGRTWTMMNVVPSVYQTDGLSLAWLSMAVSAAAGSLAGGFVFDWLSHYGRSLWGLDVRVLYLAVVQVSMLTAWFAKHRLSTFMPQTPARDLMAAAIKRVVGDNDSERP